MDSDEVTSVWGQWIGAGAEAREMEELRRLLLRRRRGARAISFFWSVAVVAVIAYTAVAQPLLGVPAAALFVTVTVQNLRGSRQRREDMNDRNAGMRATDAGIESRSRTYSEWYAWDRVSDVIDGSLVVVLVTGPERGWILAKRHFPSTAAVDDFVRRARNLANSTAPLEPVDPPDAVGDPITEPPAPPS